MAVSTVTQPWEFTAQGDIYVPDTPDYGPFVGVGLRPFIRRIALVAAAAGSYDVRDSLNGQTLTGLVTIAGATTPAVIEIHTAVKGIYIQVLSGTGNKVLVWTGRDDNQ